MMSKKRIVLISIVSTAVAVVVLGYVTLRESATGTITVDRLSDRAQLFVKEQQKDVTSIWQSQQLELTTASVVHTPEPLQTIPCFSINLLLLVQSIVKRSVDDCIMQSRLIAPASRLTISVYSDRYNN